MPNLPTLKRSPGGVIYMHWTEPAKEKGSRGRSKRVSTGTQDMAAAEAFRLAWLSLDRAGVLDMAPTLPISDFWEVYEKSHIRNPLKVAAPDSLLQSWNNLESHFGRLRLSEITDDVVCGYESARVAGKIGRPSRASTVRRELNALRACLNWCAKPKQRLIRPQDLPVFDLPPEGAPRDRWLKLDEMQKLFDAAARLRRGERLSRVERFLWLALETAARKEAIYDLTWDRVDFETKVIHYNVPGRRTTKKRRASVPISSALMPVLRRAFDERENDMVLDNSGEVWATLQLVVIEAGLAKDRRQSKRLEKPKATGISPHVLRHTAATHMARRGVPLWVIAGILGNSLAMVEKVYSHHCPEGLRGGVEKISAGVLEPAE